MSEAELDSAYRHCLKLARNHYENFPVASHLLPRRLRRPVAAIYAFARTADDFADEGERSTAERLALLDDYAEKLQRLERGEQVDEPIFIALAHTVRRHHLPWALLHDLLSAFRQDAQKRRYADYAEVLDYCRRSADPVGRLLLHLYDEATAENLALADKICTALQLINFWQDLAQDCDENDRIYLPQDEMAACGVKVADLRARRETAGLQQLIARQLARSRELLQTGAPLGRRLPGRLGLEMRLIVGGGLRLLTQLERRESVFARPRHRLRDWLWVAGYALLPALHSRN